MYKGVYRSREIEIARIRWAGVVKNSFKYRWLAERVGFEPTLGINLNTLSKRMAEHRKN